MSAYLEGQDESEAIFPLCNNMHANFEFVGGFLVHCIHRGARIGSGIMTVVAEGVPTFKRKFPNPSPTTNNNCC